MRLSFINVPLNLGCNRLGVETSGAYIRNVYLKDNLQFITDCGDINCSCSFKRPANPKMKNISEILSICSKLGDRVCSVLNHGAFPLIYGGDHSLTWGSLNGVVEKYGKDICVIYIDAHGDFNTSSTSLSGNVHGMHMAYLMGYGEKEYVDFYSEGKKIDNSQVLFVATRSLDPGEMQLAKNNKFNIITSEEINQSDDNDIIFRVKQWVLSQKKPVHISFDIDSVDPILAPGTGVPENNGVSDIFVIKLIHELLLNTNVVSMDVVEFNPLLDIDRKTEKIIISILSEIINIISKK